MTSTARTRPAVPTIANIDAIELESAFISGDLVDEAGDPVPLSVVTAFELTLYDKATGAIINGRDAENILNVNGGTFDEDGHFTVTFASDDLQIVDDSELHEKRIALLVVTWGSSGRWNRQVELRVRNLVRVGA